jgi:hypothetical protein
MAAPLNTCTTIEQRGVVRFLWAKSMDAAKDIHKEMLPVWAKRHAVLSWYMYSGMPPPSCNSCYVCTFMRIPIIVRNNKTR